MSQACDPSPTGMYYDAAQNEWNLLRAEHGFTAHMNEGRVQVAVHQAKDGSLWFGDREDVDALADLALELMGGEKLKPQKKNKNKEKMDDDNKDDEDAKKRKKLKMVIDLVVDGRGGWVPGKKPRYHGKVHEQQIVWNNGTNISVWYPRVTIVEHMQQMR